MGGGNQGGRTDSAEAEAAGVPGGQGALGVPQAATDPVLGPRRRDAEATLQATEFEDRPQAPAVRRDSITIAPATSVGVRRGHNRSAPEPDNNLAGQSTGAGDNNSSGNADHHFRLSGLGRRLRHLFVDWCVEYEAWMCLSHFGDPQQMSKRPDSSATPQTRGWGRDRVSLLRSFFEALSSNNVHNWCNSLFRRKMCLLGFLGDELFGPMNKLSQQTSSWGRAPLSLRCLWAQYGSTDMDLATALLNMGSLKHTQRRGQQPRSAGSSPLLRDFLTILDHSSLFHQLVDTHSILLWNLGPHGFEKSGLHIERIFSENRSVICLQDLRISLRRKEEIRNDLERRFPYKVFISVYQHRATQRHRNTGYVFSTLTALHTGVFLSAFSFQLGAPDYRHRKGKRRMVFTDSGRALCLTATLRSGEQLHLLNVYQFTAAHTALQSQLWDRLTAWIRKHSAEKILLLGDLNSTMPEALISREIVWQDIGRHRPRGRTEYSNEGLKALLRPGSLVWTVKQASNTRHPPTPLSPDLEEIVDRKYGELREGLTVEFTAEEWLQADIHALRFEDSLSMGKWLLVAPKRPRRAISTEDWAALSPKLGLRWEIVATRPAQEHEVKHEGLRTLLLASLDLNERDLDALHDLSLQQDSFVSLTSTGPYVRPIPHAPPPHHCYIQVLDHFFIPSSNAAQMRSGYSLPRNSNLQYADALFANFLSSSKGTWHPALGHTWKNRAGRAATLDHLISWNLTSPCQGSPVPRWTDGPGNDTVGCAGMKYDHAQLLIAVDSFTVPAPPPPQPGGLKPQRQAFDPVLFESQLAKWKHAVQTLLEPTPAVGETMSGQATFDRHQSDCQKMLGVALSLQSRAQAARRRAHERPADRNKMQRTAMQDIQLYTCALRETVEPQHWSSADLPLATRRALQRLGLQRLTVLQAKFLRILPLWRRCIHRALEQSRNTLAAVGESQRKEAEKALRRRFHWLFEKGVKGIQRILGKRKPQQAMESVTQRCPCGLQWKHDDVNSTSTLLTWARQAAPWMDTDRYTIHADQSHVSVKVHVLTDLYPLIQSSLRCPPFADGGPPKLLYETGPWTGDNICTALECFFQSNAYHPQATCDQCGHSGSIPISIRVDSMPTVQSGPAAMSTSSTTA